MWSSVERLNFTIGGAVLESAGIPSGYLHPSSWTMPRKAGSGNANAFAYSDGRAVGATGRNGIADATAAATGTATGTAVSSGLATGDATATGTAIGIARISGTADGAATSSGTALPSAAVRGTATGNATSTGTVVPYAIAWGTASNETGSLTANGIASSVWAALAAANDEPGTMGALLNASGAGGDPWAVTLEGTYTAADLLRLITAHAAGPATGLESATPRFKSLDGTKTRIDGTYNAGDRGITGLDTTP